MTFTVTRSSGVAVQPSESTPSSTLNLSVIDSLPGLRVRVHSLLVFKYGHEPAKVIREALSKALVRYYPLARRLKESSDGELQVACTREGVWFVEAFSDCSLEDHMYLDNILLVPHDDLLATPPPETYGMDPLVQIQLTVFKSEGFVIGFTLCHSVCDGLGAIQFLSAVGEFARGFLHPTIAPVWDRETLPAPAWLTDVLRESKLLPPPPTPSYQLAHASIDISEDQIYKLKNEFFELTGELCSTFDVVAASFWCHRTRAVQFPKDTTVHLVFFPNTRHLSDPPLPDGYYGNFIFPMTVTSSSGWLVEASTTEVVKLIKDAKTRIPTEFTKWMKSEELNVTDASFHNPLAYTTLSLTDWSHLGIKNVDYGWGPPVHVFPTHGFSIAPILAIGLPPTPKKGIRLLTWCVKMEHLPALVNYYKKEPLSRL